MNNTTLELIQDYISRNAIEICLTIAAIGKILEKIL